ncbi:unnamed protein product [Periconia digitata]|uniref:Uncharacterized protein n=1 Tax=Periconia digitata TaxID=1303443 RepID=A0A9W4UDE8_9PLEO|nr:unnamed protein product [Periconia digitata]
MENELEYKERAFLTFNRQYSILHFTRQSFIHYTWASPTNILSLPLNKSTGKHYCKMHRATFIVFFNLLTSLGSVVGADTLYRGDSRSAKTIFNDGGFKAKGYDNPEGTLFEHVEGTLKHPSRDPYISTSNDIEVSKKHAGNGLLFFIDSSKITEEIFDVAAEYEKAGKKYGHADEKEFAVKKFIPWNAITKIQKKKDGEWKTIKMPTASSSDEPEFVPDPTTLVVMPSPTAAPPLPAFQAGTCCFHLNQWDDCNSENEDLTCEVTLLDNAKNQIGHVDRTSCNNDNPLGMTSKLPSVLVVTGEHQNNYIQFNYGALAFTSSDEARCSVGGWDPREDLCFIENVPRKRQMDCCFPC